MYFSVDPRQNVFLKISEDNQKNVFSGVLFEQFELSNLPPITMLKADSTENISCECSENLQNCWEGVRDKILF